MGIVAGILKDTASESRPEAMLRNPAPAKLSRWMET
jgi:hypothetical protein